MIHMTPVTTALIFAAGGAIIGAGAAFAVFWMHRARTLREAQARPELPEAAKTVLDAVDRFAVILDAALNPVYANPAARHDQFVSGEELSDPAFIRRARAVMSTGAPYVQQPDPEDPADSIRVHIVRIQQGFIAVLAEDIGEEQRVDAMRRDFIANVSHELKTPIAAMSLLAEAVQQASDDPRLVRDFAERLVKETKRMGLLSRDIIQLSEAQSTLRPEDREPVSLIPLVEQEVEAHRGLAQQQGVELVTTVDDDREAIAMGRRAALGTAIANLVSNAIQHSPRGGRVGIGIAREGKRLTVTVTDRGEGIAPEHQRRIFERFYRVDSSRSRGETGGTGLGLSIARHTMRAHGGDVDLWSQPGVGSSFTLTIPLYTEPKSPKKSGRVKKAKRAVKRAAEHANRTGGETTEEPRS